MNALIALVFYLLTVTGDPCQGNPAANWRDVLEHAPPAAYIIPPQVRPFVVVYEYQGARYVFVSNPDNDHGRCMIRL